MSDRRHDEAAYDNLRTLEALSKTGTVVARVYNILRLLTRIKHEDVELWERIKKFAEEVRDGKR